MHFGGSGWNPTPTPFATNPSLQATIFLNNLILKKHLLLYIINRGVFMCLSDFSNEDLIVLSSTLAIAISKDFTTEDLLLLAAFFTTLGDNLALLVL